MRKNKKKLDVSVEEFAGNISLFNEKLNSGWLGIEFYLEYGKKRHSPKSGEFIEISAKKVLWRGRIKEGLYVDIEIVPSPTGEGQAITPFLINHTKSDILFSGYGYRPSGAESHIKIHDTLPENMPGKGGPVYAHGENMFERGHYFGYPFVRHVPAQPLRVGEHIWLGTIPALMLGNENSDIWLLEGALTQRRHIISWDLNLIVEKPVKITCTSRYIWTGSEAETVPAGKRIRLETTLYKAASTHLDSLYLHYIKELYRLYRFAGRDSSLKAKSVFCTWNYGARVNINEKDCIKRMDVAGKLQKGGYFQIDHGYQPRVNGKPAVYNVPFGKQLLDPDCLPPQTTALNSAQPARVLDVFYPDCREAWDKTRFPSGPEGFVAACSKRALLPAIWWTPSIARKGIIAEKHPEWVLNNASGNAIGTAVQGYLDYSVPGVREFLETCVATITGKWGFRGMKLDFYSSMFDHPEAVFKEGGTGIFWKNHFVAMLRSHFGKSGYLLHCITCPMGNPFMALNGFDAFRAGFDIGWGSWERHVRSVPTLPASVIASGEKTWFANIDSCMGHPRIPANERRFRLAFAYITSGMLEFSGFAEHFDKGMLRDWKTIQERYDPGKGFRCPEEEMFYGKPFPKILVRHHHKNGKTQKNFGIKATAGFFNWKDSEEIISIHPGKIGVKTQEKQPEIRDFWNGRRYGIKSGMVVAALPPRSHLLLDIH